MKIIKKIVIYLFIALKAVSLCCSEQQVASLDETEQKVEHMDVESSKKITLISSDGKRYSVPYDIGMQSNFIEASLTGEKEEKEIEINIPAQYLGPLIEALEFIDNNKKENTKLLYEYVQKILMSADGVKKFQENPFGTLKTWLESVAYLYLSNSHPLYNAIADKFAQIINPGNVDQFLNTINWQHWRSLWPLVEKYYYLRSGKLKLNPVNLILFYNIPEAKMDISVQDLLDYGKDIRVVKKVYHNNIARLDLSDFGLTSLNGLKNIAGIQEVEELYLHHNQLRELQPGVFIGLDKLRKLSFSNNQLIELQLGVFTGLNNLKSLTLSNNQLIELQPGVFTGLNNLKNLFLSNNQLIELQPGVFTGLDKLTILHLDNNQLSVLQQGVFTGLDKLTILHLDNNQLSVLQPEVFTELGKLEVLYLSRNPLSELQQGVFNGLNNLTDLYLCGNQLSELQQDVFNGLNNLKNLYLSRNLLRELQQGVFNGLNNLNYLYLSRTRLSDASKQMFSEYQQQHPNVYILWDIN